MPLNIVLLPFEGLVVPACTMRLLLQHWIGFVCVLFYDAVDHLHRVIGALSVESLLLLGLYIR